MDSISQQHQNDHLLNQQFESKTSNSGLQLFSERPLNPHQLQMRFAKEYQHSLENPPLVTMIDDGRLLPDQEKSLTVECPVTVLVLGACGSLASGFLSRGAFELESALGSRSPVRYVMCDIFASESEQAQNLIEKRKAEGEYKLHHETPYLCVHDLDAQKIRELDIDLAIAATPPNIHLEDAQRAERLGLLTFIEKPAYPAGMGSVKRPIIEAALASGKIGLIDFFLGNRALIDFLEKPEMYLSGELLSPEFKLGAIEFIHATCLEPHSVKEEGARQQMLMSYEAQGGFLYADQAPHPLAVIDATLRAILQLSLDDSIIAATYRTREVDVSGPPDAETAASVLRTLSLKQESRIAAMQQIELLSVVGKGLQVEGGAESVPLTNYMLSIGCQNGRLDICIGNGENTLPSYLCLSSKSNEHPAKLFQYARSGMGYGLILADFAIAAQSKKMNLPIPEPTRTRLNRQTESSMAAMRAIEDVYKRWDRSSDSVQRYGTLQDLPSALMPDELPLGCFIHGCITEDESRRIKRELLKQNK